jgi:hypothetical protein
MPSKIYGETINFIGFVCTADVPSPTGFHDYSFSSFTFIPSSKLG